jgi:hypothetical protein
MPIQEPGGALWAEVSQFTKWPDDDEDAIATMSAGWRGGGGHFTRASAFDLAPVAEGWPDRAGQAFHGRTSDGLRTLAGTGAQMTELAGRADAYAAEVAGVKGGISALMAANQAGYETAARLPAPARETFVQQVAAMVDSMKAEAAARISATGPATARPAQEPAPPGPPAGGDPRAVNAWWNGLTEEQRDYYRARPDMIGNLDGVPARERSRANLSILDDTIAGLKAQQAGSPEAAERLGALEALKKRFGVAAPGAKDQLLLLGFDNGGDGQAIVSVGDPDTAKNVATLVPGITNDIGSVPMQIDRAASLRSSPDTASIVWLDYNTPESLAPGPDGVSLTPLVQDRAIAASGDFAQFQNGLRATHMGDPSHNVVVAHSYGTTVAGIASRDQGLNADQLVLVASTDPGVQHVSQLRFLNPDGTEVPAGEVPQRVFATTADNDTFAHVPTWLLSNDPSEPGFGAQVFSTPDRDSDTHSGAFYAGPALDAIKYIVNVGS